MTIKEAPSIFGIVIKAISRELKKTPADQLMAVMIKDEMYESLHPGRKLKRWLEIYGEDVVNTYPLSSRRDYRQTYSGREINYLEIERIGKPWWSPFTKRIYWE